jgi:hypothetical protein
LTTTKHNCPEPATNPDSILEQLPKLAFNKTKAKLAFNKTKARGKHCLCL